MRELVSSRAPIGQRTDAFGTEATALLGVIASLQQTSVASAVKRTADDLAAGVIAPAAGGPTADLPGAPNPPFSQGRGAVAPPSKTLSAAPPKTLHHKPLHAPPFL